MKPQLCFFLKKPFLVNSVCFSFASVVSPRYCWRPLVIKLPITPPEAYFHIFDFFSETTNRWQFLLSQPSVMVNHSEIQPTDILA